MSAFIVRRLLASIVTIWIIATLAFAMRLTPGDPVRIWLGAYATPTLISEVRGEWGLDRPVWSQYAMFIWGLLRGDLGRSFRTDRSVAADLREQYPYTIALTWWSMVAAVLLGATLGIQAGIRPNNLGSVALTGGTVLWISMPDFWLGLLLIVVLGTHWPYLPFMGAGKAGDFFSSMRYLVLPALALGSREAAVISRMMRSAIRTVMTQDYLRTARAKGLEEHVVVFRHALRNALLPVIGTIGVDATTLLGGAVVVEAVFSRPGIGRIAVDAITNRDYPELQGVILFFSVAVVLIGLVTDIAYAATDPRIRFQ